MKTVGKNLPFFVFTLCILLKDHFKIKVYIKFVLTFFDVDVIILKNALKELLLI